MTTEQELYIFFKYRYIKYSLCDAQVKIYLNLNVFYIFYMIDHSKMKAARALLGWSQADLAERAGLTQATVANIETGKHQPSKATLSALTHALQAAGIEFTHDGVRHVNSMRTLSGSDAVIRLLDDVYYTLRDIGGELLIGGADERQTRSGIIPAIRRIRGAGIRMRVLIEENNRHLLAPIEEYRWIPSRYFVNNPFMIYGDHVAITLPIIGQDMVYIFINEALAADYSRLFDFVWDHCAAPTASEAAQVYPPYSPSLK